MKYTPDRRSMGRFLKSSQVHRPLTLAGGAWLSRARANVGRDSGETAASGRLVHTQNGGAKGDRWQVSVVFGGAAVAHQFGNRRVRPTRFLTRSGPNG